MKKAVAFLINLSVFPIVIVGMFAFIIISALEHGYESGEELHHWFCKWIS